MAEVGSVKTASADCVGVPLRLAEHAHYVRMDDQVIVADMRSGHYFGLDGIGARLWELIGEHLDLDTIVERLYSEYEVSMEVLRRDVGELLQELVRRGLVEEKRNRTSSATSGT